METDRGDLLYVQSRGVRHGTPEAIARLGCGEDVNPAEDTLRTSTEIETAHRSRLAEQGRLRERRRSPAGRVV
jgi:hypothetical protein